jgi:hypothetical protein
METPQEAPMNNRANLGTADQISGMEDELTDKMVQHTAVKGDRVGNPVI